jgi:hypothetical protein
MPRNPAYDDDDDSPLDERGILKDGRSIRVSLFDAIAARGWAPPDRRPGGPFVVDSRPGAWAPPDTRRPLTDAEVIDARQRCADAYAAYDAHDARAWQRPPNGPSATEYTGNNPSYTGHGAPGRGRERIPAGSYPLSAGEGSRCTINGRDGRLRRSDDGRWLECVPVEEPEESADALTLADAQQRLRDARARAIEEYDRQQSEAWKHPR